MEVLKERLLAHRLILPEIFYDHCAQYASALLGWNKIHNLSGATTLDQLRDHLFDSLYPLTFLEDFQSAIDIGTGAGFPGLILAMAKERSRFELVEPLQKRAGFLQFVVSTLKLTNVTVVNSRIEQLPPHTVDLITSRAVSRAKDLYDLSLPFMDEKTQLLLYKGQNTASEAESIRAESIRADHATYLLARRQK